MNKELESKLTQAVGASYTGAMSDSGPNSSELEVSLPAKDTTVEKPNPSISSQISEKLNTETPQPVQPSPIENVPTVKELVVSEESKGEAVKEQLQKWNPDEGYTRQEGKWIIYYDKSGNELKRLPEIKGAQEPAIRLRPGLTEDQLRVHVEQVIRQARRNGVFLSDFPGVMKDTPSIVTNYDYLPGAPEISEDVKNELSEKILIRAILNYCTNKLANKQFKEIKEAISADRGFKEINFQILWRETFNNPENRLLFQELTRITERPDPKGRGAYWREKPLIDPTTNQPVRDQYGEIVYPEGSAHEEIRRMIEEKMRNNERDYATAIQTARDTVEEFQKITLFASYCVGPINPQTNRLLFEDILDEVDAMPGKQRQLGPRKYYADTDPNTGFPLFWEKVWKFYTEEKAPDQTDPAKPLIDVKDPRAKFDRSADEDYIGDPAENGLMLLDSIENLKWERTIKARWLAYAGQIYVMSYIHLLGFREPSQLFEYYARGGQDMVGGFRFGTMLHSGGEAYDLMINFLNRPLPAPYPLEKWPPEQMLKPTILPVLEKMNDYIRRLAPGMMPYVTFRLLSSAINYMREDNVGKRPAGSLLEKKSQFKEDYKPGWQTRYDIIHDSSIQPFVPTAPINWEERLEREVDTSPRKALYKQSIIKGGQQGGRKGLSALLRAIIEKFD